jgi:NAD(P)-dependent dehydrogenase (short-subunit alcohol dehydrogenase family)
MQFEGERNMILKDRRIAITGAFGALGTAVVRRALVEGARVAALDHAAAPRSASDFVDAVLVGGVDLADAQGANSALADAAAALGGVDALVNIAGGFAWEKIEGGSLDTWDRMYRLNERTAVAASQAALPHLLKSASGRIVNISAAGAMKAAAGMGAYAASKSGVARLTEALAEELKDRGITINALLPSIIDTAANRADMPDADFSRWVRPEQIGDAIVFLLSDRAQAITGALIPIVGRV